MVTTLVQTAVAVLGDRAVNDVRLLIDGGVIVAVGQQDLPADRRIRVDGTLLPGFVDLQVNGGCGNSVDEATPAALQRIGRCVQDGGAVAFLPTLITAPFDELLRQTAAVAEWIATFAGDGAVPLGLHLEGPFLESAGAHASRHFVDPTPSRVDALLEAARGQLRLVTLAPARAGAVEATRALTAAGVTVALGHAHSTTAFTACVDAGARLVTHLFNAMSPLHHRDVGVAGHALDEPRLACSMIVDGVHVHPAMVRNAWRCLGRERTVLVTDAVAAAGMPDGDYRLSGMPVHLRQGVVRDDDGTLAGSALTMARAVDNFAAFTGADLPALARVAATNPAALIGADLGALAPGKRALFTVKDTSGWRCLRVD